MSDRPGVDNLVAAIDVRTQAIRGFGVAAALTALWFVVFVVLPSGLAYPVGLLVGLGFVLWFTAGMLATIAFAGVRVYVLTRDLEDAPA
jgi:hypothetical protein